MSESTTSNIGHLREFNPAISEWSIFKRRIDNYFVANTITDEKRKGAILLNVLSEEAYKLVFNMCLPEEPETKTHKVLSDLLTNHFKPSESVFAARYKFYTAKKGSTETAKEWAARLRNFAAQCQFNNLQLEMVLRDIFIVNYDKGSVQDRLLEEKNSVTFTEMVELASAKSATQASMNNWENLIKKEVDLHYAGTQSCQSVSKKGSPPDQESSRTSNTSNQQNKCEICGRRNHSKDKCFYRDCLCHICDDLQFLFKKYKRVFEPGLGTFTKGKISIKLKSDGITPKFFRARPLPFAMREKVEQELERLLSLGVIEPVDYSPWGTPVVPVIKKDGSVRLCGDFKVTLNPHIEIDKYPLPRIEQLFASLQGGEHFTKLDLANAYTQICLEEDSKNLVVITTHKGLFRYTRAPFGIASIPSKFQKLMESLLQGVDGVVIFIDDIVVTGKDRAEHLERLEKVFERLQDAGFKISDNKCEFFKSKITYMGYQIDKTGLHTCQEKIEAINKAPVPKDISQLKSFLGLVNYYGKFVPNLSSILHPLYNLLRDRVQWRWSANCERAFRKIKEILTSADVLVHYNPDLPFEKPGDAKIYSKVVTQFEGYFIPSRNDTFESHVFLSRDMKPVESVDKYVTNLRELSATCNFGDLTDFLIKDKLVHGIRGKSVKDRLLRTKNSDLAKALEICKAAEKTENQVNQSCGDLEEQHLEEEINVIKSRNRKTYQRNMATKQAQYQYRPGSRRNIDQKIQRWQQPTSSLNVTNQQPSNSKQEHGTRNPNSHH
ncbi:uncharacterized protein LOC123318216 [Coccinella septempunctata]|uniref:uncharacterized protein LOC123318216 n=1 Tax=Coccinella septempunctata TaxID=41139 RepID=UPI001D07C555|nr:uncharacterized protein LOC123318216 [Coccinella septempunctata]